MSSSHNQGNAGEIWIMLLNVKYVTCRIIKIVHDLGCGLSEDCGSKRYSFFFSFYNGRHPHIQIFKRNRSYSILSWYKCHMFKSFTFLSLKTKPNSLMPKHCISEITINHHIHAFCLSQPHVSRPVFDFLSLDAVFAFQILVSACWSKPLLF